MTKLLKWLTGVAGSVLFLRSDSFKMARMKAEEIYLLGEAEVERQVWFLLRVILIPAGLVALACLGGYLGTEVFHFAYAESIAKATVRLAAFSCALGLFAVWAQATLFAHVLVIATRLGVFAARVVTGLAGKVIGEDLKMDETAPLEAAHADRFANWLRNIIAWILVICALVSVLPIWSSPGTVACITIGILALAMFMAKVQSELPRRVAMWSMLGLVVYGACTLWFPAQVERSEQWVRKTTGNDSTADNVLYARKIEELRDEHRAIIQRGLDEEVAYASPEDEARDAEIGELIAKYKAIIDGRTPAPKPTAKPTTVVQAPTVTQQAPATIAPPTPNPTVDDLPAPGDDLAGGPETAAAGTPDAGETLMAQTETSTPPAALPAPPAPTSREDQLAERRAKALAFLKQNGR
jgi:hypothetical protein